MPPVRPRLARPSGRRRENSRRILSSSRFRLSPTTVRFVSFRWRTVDGLAPRSLADSSESLIREVERASEPASPAVTAVIKGGL
jgi:hypothetical protein